jgi:hypothetical protein
MLFALDMLADLAARLGRLDLVRPVVETAAAHNLNARATLAHAKAVVAEHDRALATAIVLYREEADIARALGNVPARAYALLGVGRSLAALREDSDARTALDAARELFTSMGAQPALREVDSLLAGLSRAAS